MSALQVINPVIPHNIGDVQVIKRKQRLCMSAAIEEMYNNTIRICNIPSCII